MFVIAKTTWKWWSQRKLWNVHQETVLTLLDEYNSLMERIDVLMTYLFTLLCFFTLDVFFSRWTRKIWISFLNRFEMMIFSQKSWKFKISSKITASTAEKRKKTPLFVRMVFEFWFIYIWNSLFLKL